MDAQRFSVYWGLHFLFGLVRFILRIGSVSIHYFDGELYKYLLPPTSLAMAVYFVSFQFKIKKL
jgi:hypothetical protein